MWWYNQNVILKIVKKKFLIIILQQFANLILLSINIIKLFVISFDKVIISNKTILYPTVLFEVKIVLWIKIIEMVFLMYYL